MSSPTAARSSRSAKTNIGNCSTSGASRERRATGSTSRKRKSRGPGRSRRRSRASKRKVPSEDVRDLLKQQHPENFDGVLRFVRDSVGKSRQFTNRSKFV